MPCAVCAVCGNVTFMHDAPVVYNERVCFDCYVWFLEIYDLGYVYYE